MAVSYPWPPASPATEYPTSTGHMEQHLFFVGVNGQLMHSWWDGVNPQYQWGLQQLATSITPGSDPIVLLLDTSADLEMHVFFRGSDGSLQQVWYDGVSWFPANSSQTMPGPPVSAPPSDMGGHDSGCALGGVIFPVGSTPVPQQHVFYCGTDGALNDCYWDGASWRSQQPVPPGNVAGPPTAQSIEIPPANSPTYQLNVFYAGTSGSLQIASSTDGVQWRHGPVPNQFANAQGPPAAAFGGFYDNMAVFYAGQAVGGGTGLWRGAIRNGQWGSLEVRSSIGSYPVASSDSGITPNAMKDRAFYIVAAQLFEHYFNLTDGTNSEQQLPGSPLRLLGVAEFHDGPHVFYLASDGSLQQTYGDDGNWQTGTIAPPNTVASYSWWQPGGGSGTGCNLLSAQLHKLRQRLGR
jgi:Repeat of unknown function (DUF346)